MEKTWLSILEGRRKEEAVRQRKQGARDAKQVRRGHGSRKNTPGSERR